MTGIRPVILVPSGNISNSPKPEISVVIVTYNRCDSLREVLVSVAGQGGVSKEIIVIDNGSTDGTAQMVSSEFPEARLLRLPENLGPALGRNIGIVNANGEFLFFLDDDALLADDSALSRIVSRLRGDDSIGVLVCHVRNAETGQICNWPSPRKAPSEYANKEFDILAFPEGVTAFRKEALAHTGLYPGNFFRQAEGLDLAIRMVDAGYRIVYYPQVLALHKEFGRKAYSRQIAYFNVRNNLWIPWKYFPCPLAVVKTGLVLVRTLAVSVRHCGLFTWLAAVLDAGIKMPQILRERRVVGELTIRRIKELNR
ncbi:MAG: glycosyltransferase [Bacillota bacterium]|nr:glycosyltransferase [Bacillota bacterium]